MKLKLDFLKRIITNTITPVGKANFFKDGFPSDVVMEEFLKAPIDNQRMEGLDWPKEAHTMIGMKRLNNLHQTLDYVRENNIPGDFIETGVWRGGACIFAKMYMDMYEMDKKVFVSDSFDGLPKPDLLKYPQDAGDEHWKQNFLKVSLEEVKSNFELYSCLDDKVIFLKGWFKDTLGDERIQELSLLRFDGDMYGSTMDVLNNCYDKVSKNGIIIIDDYCLPNCVKAVTDFRNQRKITEELKFVDKCGVWWIKN